MLDRYKKSGGFLQLVKLLEGFGKEKKEKFLKLVEAEDPMWAEILDSKLLSIERILGWSDVAVAEITTRMHDKNMAAVLHGISAEKKDHLLSIVGTSDRTRFENALDEIKPSAGEISASMVMMLEQTRELISKKYLKLEDIDPDMIIPDDIEEHISSGGYLAKRVSSSSNSSERTALERDPRIASDRAGAGSLDKEEMSHPLSSDRRPEDVTTSVAQTAKAAMTENHGEIDLLKRKVINLTKENSLLKKENQALANRLDQIKKIA